MVDRQKGLIMNLTMGDYEAARPYYEKALEIYRNVLGEEHPDTAQSLSNMGFLLGSMGDYEAARPYYEKALEIYRNVLGEEHPDTKTVRNTLELLDSKISSSKKD